MKIEWLGQASMLLTSSDGTKVITDPYTPGVRGVNYAPIEEEADIVTTSHDHRDHNNVSAVKGNPQVIRGAGTHSAKGIQFLGIVSYHDDTSGSQRGPNTVFCFTLDGIRVCHLGDLGHALSPQNQAEISPVDLLLIPVGGNFTIDARLAADTCRRLSPKVIIPMHFRNDRCPEFPVAGVEDFLALMEKVQRKDTSEVEFYKDSLPEDTEVVVLKPAR